MADTRRAGRRRTVLLAGAGVLVLVLAAGGWALFLRPSDAGGAEVTYRATAVTTGTLRQTVAASGTVAATDTEDLSFAASGEVTDVWVTAGQKVAKGARLAAIDSAALKSALAAAKATLAAAQAKLASDTTSGATSTQLAADSAAITVAQAEVTGATADLSGATLTAPFAGTVTSVTLSVGQQVGGGSSGSGSAADSGSGSAADSRSGSAADASSGTDGTTAASAAIHLVSTGSYVVDAGVDSSDIGLIAKGNQVLITVGDTTKTVFGTLSSVGIVATSTSGVATFPVVVAVTGSPTGVYPGATATLQIVYKQLSDVLLVPTQAISRTDSGSTVLVQNGDRQERRTIRTGLSSGAQTQVTGGLTEGEQVLVPVPTEAGGGARTTDGRTGRTDFETGGGQFPGGGRFPGGGPDTVPGGGPGKGNGP